MDEAPSSLRHPPAAWPAAHRLIRRIVGPVERFLEIEAASGIVLLAAAIVALVWANSPWAASYDALWSAPLGVRLGRVSLARDVHFFINDGLMSVFFFVIGLELRWELQRGQLSDVRRAALPLAAALGGMLLPAAIFLLTNRGHASMRGWGIPMATDIAFAVGALALLGKRVPSALRVLLLALAVIDDLGAIVVIAVFYSAELSLLGFVVMGGGLVAIVATQKLGARNPWAYAPAAGVAWVGANMAGIHPTLAGVMVGLMTPATAWYGRERFLERIEAIVARIGRQGSEDERYALLPDLEALDDARQEVLSPSERLQHALHGAVAFGIMPLFALANAGVRLDAHSLAGDAALIFAGVSFGLVLGKPIGIVTVAWSCSRLGLTALPRGVSWPQVGIVGLVGGIGFTMALFIAELAFAKGPSLEAAKLAILAASGTAAALGLIAGRFILPKDAPPKLTP